MAHMASWWHKTSPLRPWLLCMLLASASASALKDVGDGFDWFLDNQFFLAVGLMLTVASGGAALRDHFLGSGGAGPFLAAAAFLLWHLGLLRSPAAASSPQPWCLAVAKAIEGRSPEEPVDHHTAALGLVLLDDMLRAVLRFVAGSPPQAWPFALINRKSHTLWVNDDEWWEACYRGMGWMKLPKNPQLTSGLPQVPSTRCLLKEAMLWASLMVETLGMMVILPPRCAAQRWAVAPCVASTLLVVSCAPWLPRQSDMILVEMRQLLRVVSRFAMYFQAVWVIVIRILLRPEEIIMCSLPKGNIILEALEAAAAVALYLLVVGQLWLVTARCRAASPLYAVPAEDVVSDPPLRSRPLYCGSLGLVEGSHAPTRMCDWEAVASSKHLNWRDRCALRRCAESLAAREAHLLSHLDALELRIGEAEAEAQRSRASARQPFRQFLNNALFGEAFSIFARAGSAVIASFAAILLCATASRVWRQSYRPHVDLPWSLGGGTMETVLWTVVLMRIVGDSWYFFASPATACGQSCHAKYGTRGGFTTEAAQLRRQACELHQSLMETQQMACRLEDEFDRLGIQVERNRSWQAADGMSGTPHIWTSSPVALRGLAFGWLSSFLVEWRSLLLRNSGAGP